MIDRRRTYPVLLAVLAVGADQLSKRWVLIHVGRAGGHLALPGPVDLTLSLNQSNAFGLAPVIGHATRWALAGANLLVAAIVLYVLVTGRTRTLVGYGLACVMAGATGNALDRIFYGSVVDFLDASKTGFVWIFNLADATIDLGIALVILGSLMGRRDVGQGATADGP
jgi:signal peptidase II